MGGVITVVDYDRRWPSLFEALKSQYHEALTGIPVVGIEHVGSTSVRGLAAKPVIDVDIIVAAVHAQQAIDAMERSGFRSRGELGIPDRWAFRTPPDLPATNTYVVIDGSLALRNHLAVRDMLRSDPSLREEYAALKRAIASTVEDIDNYVEAKSEFLSSVLQRAGLTVEERQQIKHENRAP